MKIIRKLSETYCGAAPDCPCTYELNAGDDIAVRGYRPTEEHRRVLADYLRDHEGGDTMPDNEDFVIVPRPVVTAVTPKPLDLKALGAWMFQPGITDLLRVETLDRYESAADHPHLERWLKEGRVEIDEGWQSWLDSISRDTASGKTWRRVHVLRPVDRVPLNDYLRFELGVQYVANARAGEQIRILEMDDPDSIGDFFVLNGEQVALSTYRDGRLQHADVVEHHARGWVALANQLWSAATPFDAWWATHQQRRAA